MNRTQLVEQVAARTGLRAGDVTTAIDTALGAIVETVARGEDVSLAGFGTFDRRQRSARTGRNPQTGEAMEIPATLAPGFKAALAFRRTVAGDR
jgi:DNA-binding protein HU-beta